MSYWNKLKELINDAVKSGAFPGATFGLVCGGIKVDYIGKRALYPEVEENSLETIYDLASLSKVIGTTSAVLRLLEEGKLRLFDRVVKYLPRLRHEQLTIWHLMTHTSGMRECCVKVTEIKSKEEVWEQIYSFDLKEEPGQKIIYSDLNYIMLGRIVEIVSGLSLDQFVKSEVFVPLEMVDTGYNPIDTDRCAPTEERKDDVVRGIVRGKVHDETAYILGGVSGHAGVFSTVSDLTHYVQMVLNKGTFRGKKIFSRATIERLFEVQVSQTNGTMRHADRRGLGWIINSQNSSAGDLTSYETILHTGFTGTNIWIDRVNQVGFIMLTNRVHPTRNNALHIEVRAKVANFIIAHLDELKKEISNESM